MSLLQRFSRTLRSGSINPISTLHSRTHLRNPMSTHFFLSNSIQNVGLGRRGAGLARKFHDKRRRPSTPTNLRIIWLMIGANVGVWLYGSYTQEQARQGHPQAFTSFMKNMTTNLYDVTREGRWWTTLTACFTHIGLLHLGANMLSFYYMGNMIACTPGVTPVMFLTLIFGSGLTGSLGYLVNRAQNSAGSYDLKRGLGFSGVVMGVGSAAAMMYPRAQMLLYGIVPVPLGALMAGYAIYDGYYLNDDRSNVAHGGHLGGLAFGALYYFAKLRGLRW